MHYLHQPADGVPPVKMSDAPCTINGVRYRPRWAWSEQYRKCFRCTYGNPPADPYGASRRYLEWYWKQFRRPEFCDAVKARGWKLSEPCSDRLRTMPEIVVMDGREIIYRGGLREAWQWLESVECDAAA